MRLWPGILLILSMCIGTAAPRAGAAGLRHARESHESGEHHGHSKHKDTGTISEQEFRKVARRLGVEVAAVKAVVLIEAGPGMKGFWAPGAPVVNLDGSMYARYRGKVSDRSGNPGAKVPHGLTGHPLRAWQRLTNARHNNEEGALMGTFWGMFQIGGFNYKKCGCSSVKEFVRRMSESNDAQLELFAEFLENTGYVADLRARNWSGFARKYNGASYARRGYHTKMAAAYQRFLKGESPAETEEKAAAKPKADKANRKAAKKGDKKAVKKTAKRVDKKGDKKTAKKPSAASKGSTNKKTKTKNKPKSKK